MVMVGILPTEDTLTAFATADDASVSSKVLLRFRDRNRSGRGGARVDRAGAPAEDALDDLQAVSAESPRSSPQHRGDGFSVNPPQGRRTRHTEPTTSSAREPKIGVPLGAEPGWTRLSILSDGAWSQ
jgi:hypothetical protein